LVKQRIGYHVPSPSHDMKSRYAELAFEGSAERAGKNEKILSRPLINHTLIRTMT
jgi:hypothetical protein